MEIKEKGIRQWYQDLSFRKKLISIGVWILPIVLVQMICINISIHYLNNHINELQKSNMNQISERFSLTLESYMDIVYQIYADENIVKSLSSYPKADSMEQATLFFTINERVKQFAETKQGIRCISLICNTGESITYDKQTGSALDNIWRDYDDLRSISPYRKVQGQSGIVLVPTEQILDNGEQENLFFLGKKVYDTENLEQGAIATVIVGIQEDVLWEICSADGTMQEHSVNFITDEAGRVVSFPDKSYIGKEVYGEEEACSLVYQTEMFRGKKLSSSKHTDKETGWILYNVYDNGYVMKTVDNVQKIYWMLLLADMFLVIVFSNLMSRSFTKYLGNIMEGIRQVGDGNLDVCITVDRADELGRIGHHFNLMTQKVKSLIQEVMEISEKKRQAEIKALEAQINPHFLYNTLDAINWMAIGKGEYEISRMLGSLGVILRYTMNQSSVVPIFEMEEWLKSYVALYQLRYKNSFEFEISIDPAVRHVKIYKLLLQPILENAILHGIKDVEGGLIRVDIGYVEDGGKLCLIVEDNGVGMDEEQVSLYNQRGREVRPGERVGTANVFERILLYYGEEGSWNISSVKGKGTIVMMLLPPLNERDSGKGSENAV